MTERSKETQAVSPIVLCPLSLNFENILSARGLLLGTCQLCLRRASSPLVHSLISSANTAHTAMHQRPRWTHEPRRPPASPPCPARLSHHTAPLAATPQRRGLRSADFYSIITMLAQKGDGGKRKKNVFAVISVNSASTLRGLLFAKCIIIQTYGSCTVEQVFPDQKLFGCPRRATEEKLFFRCFVAPHKGQGKH